MCSFGGWWDEAYKVGQWRGGDLIRLCSSWVLAALGLGALWSLGTSLAFGNGLGLELLGSQESAQNKYILEWERCSSKKCYGIDN